MRWMGYTTALVLVAANLACGAIGGMPTSIDLHADIAPDPESDGAILKKPNRKTDAADPVLEGTDTTEPEMEDAPLWTVIEDCGDGPSTWTESTYLGDVQQGVNAEGTAWAAVSSPSRAVLVFQRLDGDCIVIDVQPDESSSMSITVRNGDPCLSGGNSTTGGKTICLGLASEVPVVWSRSSSWRTSSEGVDFRNLLRTQGQWDGDMEDVVHLLPVGLTRSLSLGEHAVSLVAHVDDDGQATLMVSAESTWAGSLRVAVANNEPQPVDLEDSGSIPMGEHRNARIELGETTLHLLVVPDGDPEVYVGSGL